VICKKSAIPVIFRQRQNGQINLLLEFIASNHQKLKKIKEIMSADMSIEKVQLKKKDYNHKCVK
jgi:hypothetical protein